MRKHYATTTTASSAACNNSTVIKSAGDIGRLSVVLALIHVEIDQRTLIPC